MVRNNIQQSLPKQPQIVVQICSSNTIDKLRHSVMAAQKQMQKGRTVSPHLKKK
jgi:hypothetical protein